MAQCNRLNSLDLGDGYSLLLFQEQLLTPTPRARSFELPGDPLQYAPDRPADVQHVKLDIVLDFAQETVRGTVYTTFSTLYDALTTISFDACELHVEQVALADGKTLAFHTTDKKLLVTLDRPYQYGEQFTIAVTYHAKPRIGLHFAKPVPEDPTRPVQAFTFGQPRYHSYWFPCHDAPNDRATTEIFATVPSEFLTISNGNLLDVTDNGSTKTHHWLHNVPHATYLISLVVGDFAVIEDNYKGKPVNYYVRKDRKDDAPLYMGKTPQMIQFFSDFIGVDYPYDKYAQTVVEIYTGAMEHTTATTHGFSLLLDKRASLDVDFVPVVAHELAHQWFGDLITCRDWSNGWLNEGFATYFEHLWGEYDRGTDYFKQAMLDLKNGYLAEDHHYRRPVVYHVYHNQGFELFDGHLYNKGGWVLHMLRHQLGEAAFRRGIKTYAERNRFREVITADLERTLEEVTGRSLAGFFQQWIYSGGYPEFEVSYSWDSERKMAKVKIKQTQKVDELTPCFVTPVDLAFTLPASDEAAKDAQTTDTRVVSLRLLVGEDAQAEQAFFLPLEREPLMLRFDPDGWLLKTLKFERSAHMLRYQLMHDPDILGRIEAAQGLAERDDAESFAALETALQQDPFWGVRAAAADALGTRGSAAAQAVLLAALQTLDPSAFSIARIAVIQALGKFQAPQQREQAQRSAQVLSSLLEQGDISYRVEAAAAENLGRTHTEGAIEILEKQLSHPSWMFTLQRGLFAGLGQTGQDRALEIIESYVTNTSNHPLLRRHAIGGLVVAGRQHYLYSEAARQQAVTTLLYAVEHDSWAPSRAFAARGLLVFGERRAISTLERVASEELDDGVQRSMRLAAHGLLNNVKDDDQLKQLRKDLDEVREENRKLKEQVTSLDARIK